MLFRWLALLLFSSSSLFCQTNSSVIASLHQPAEGKGKIKVNHNQQIDEILLKHIEINRKTTTIQGYRIRIFSESGQQARDNANINRKKFVENYPDVSSYLIYDAPYFKIYVGDYRTRSEALKFYKQIHRGFPRAFIINDKINPPKL